MNLNQDGYSPLAGRSIFGAGEGAQMFANVPTSQLGGGFSYTPGGVTINGNQVQSNGGLQFDLPLSSIAAVTQQALNFSSANSAANRGFVGNAISVGQNSLTQTQNNVLSFGSSVMAASERITASAIEAQYNMTKRKTRRCFITTAVCERLGLPDDCEMLETFRNFRDSYMLSDSANRDTVSEYYRIAPEILARIDAKNDGGESLDILRDKFLLPAYEAIQAGEYERARVVYITMVIVAKTMAQ